MNVSVFSSGRDVSGDKVQLTNLTREAGGLYVCTADNGVTAPVERITRILVRRKNGFIITISSMH